MFQAAKSRYASDAYKGFIGFEVAKPVLQRAFEDTYGMKIEQVFLNLDLAIGSYRRAVGTVLPALTKVAWQIKSQEIRKDAPGITRKKFLYNLSRSSYEKNWGATYQRPGIRSRMLAAFFRIVPRVGPVQGAGVQEADAGDREAVHGRLQRVDRPVSRAAGRRGTAAGCKLPNDNFDVGDSHQGRQIQADRRTPTRNCCTSWTATTRRCRKTSGAIFSPSTRTSAFRSRPRPTRATGRELQEELSHLEAIDRDLSAPSTKVVCRSRSAATAK